MKEVMAVIRMNMISRTKEALLNEGFPAITCRKVLGRGKKKIDFSIIERLIDGREIESREMGEQISEVHRLIPKRMITMVVDDGDAKKVVDTIIKVNSTGNPGDGKIFIMPVSEAVRIRTGDTGIGAI